MSGYIAEPIGRQAGRQVHGNAIQDALAAFTKRFLDALLSRQAGRQVHGNAIQDALAAFTKR